MKTKHYILFAITSYFIILVFTLPAKPVLEQVNTHYAGIKIQGISGSLWHGQATTVYAGRNIKLDQLAWDFTLWRLLTASLATNIHASFQQQPLRAQVTLGPTGNINATDVHATIAAEELASFIAIPLAQLKGMIKLDLDHISWKQGSLPLASGEIHWQNATITVAETVQLGTTTITLRQKDESRMTAKITNQGGDLKLYGEASATADANYQLNLDLLPEKSASKNLVNSLAMFAKRKNNRTFNISSSGKIPLPGII